MKLVLKTLDLFNVTREYLGKCKYLRDNRAQVDKYHLIVLITSSPRFHLRYSSCYNIAFNTEETKRAVLEDVGVFRSFGGGAIVENTTHGLKRDVKFLKEVSQKTGVHIIAGTGSNLAVLTESKPVTHTLNKPCIPGHYLAHVQSSSVINNSVEDLFTLMREELVSGCVDDPGIKCGFIGEVASDYPIRGKS